MNDRIRELESQCWQPRQYGPPWFDSRKFARLLIKETLEVAGAGVEYGDGMEAAVNQYFGIKP